MATSRIRSLAGDTMIYGIFSIVGRFLTFMLTPIYTNYLTVTQVGNISVLFAAIAVINIVNAFGMDSAYFRFYSKNDEEHSKQVFTHSYMSIAILSGITSILIYVFAEPIAMNLLDPQPDRIDIIRLAALIPFLDALLVIPYAYLRMTRRAKRFASTRLILIVIAVTLNIIFVVVFKWQAKGIIIAQICTNLIGALIFIPEAFRFIKLKIDFKLLKDMLKFGIPTMPAMLSSIILQVSDRFFLKGILNAKEVAVYTVNNKLALPMLLFVSVFEYAWKPFYLSHFEDKDAKQLFARILTYFTLVGASIFLIIGFFIKFLVMMPFIGGRFINPLYYSGLGIIPFILAGYFFNGVYNNLAAGFQIKKRTEFLPLAIGVSAILYIALNLILIPIIGYWGSTWSAFISYSSSAIVLYIYSRKIYPIKYEWKRIAIIIGTAVVIYTVSLTLTGYMPKLSSFVFRLIAVVIFFLLLYVMKVFTPGELIRIKQLFKGRKKSNDIEDIPME